MPNGHHGLLSGLARLGFTAVLAAVLLAAVLLIRPGSAAQAQSSAQPAAQPAVQAAPAPAPAVPLLAQTAPPSSRIAVPPAPAGLGENGELPSLRTLFNYSPYINSIIAALSIAAVALFLAFFMSVGVGHIMPADFGDNVTRLVASKKYTDAAEYCRRHRNVFAASIIQRCVENPDKSHATLLNIIDAEGRRRAELVWNRLGYLMDISQIAPMLGLLGTVLGLIQAFFVLPRQSTALNSAALAFSIGGAMSATFFGLIVAVVCVAFYSVLKGRATRALSEVERVTHNIADHMKRGEA